MKEEVSPSLAAFLNFILYGAGCVCIVGPRVGPGLGIGLVIAYHGCTLALKHNQRLAGAPPLPDPGPCRTCGAPLLCLVNFRQWYCPRCQKYAD